MSLPLSKTHSYSHLTPQDSTDASNKQTAVAEDAYTTLMKNAEDFIKQQQSVAAKEAIRVGHLLTPDMFEDLKALMKKQKDASGKAWVGIDETEEFYRTGFYIFGFPCGHPI